MSLLEIIKATGSGGSELGIMFTIVSIFLAALSGLSIRVVLSLINQRWISTYHHTMTCILLPVITFVITKVIAGNIALSLGMIGALSIVRFRNPVKNPFELVIYFALIAIGISFSVRVNYGLLLIIFILLIIILSHLFQLFFSKFGLTLFSLSFDEGVNKHYLEITSISEIGKLGDNSNLIQYLYSKTEKLHNYRLAFESKEEISELKKQIQNIESIKSVEVRYTN